MNETERRNRLHHKRLEPEVQRYQPLGKRVASEFESLPRLVVTLRVQLVDAGRVFQSQPGVMTGGRRCRVACS